MHDKSDAQLLHDYARRGDEAAFAELIRRHTNLVYSAAARQVDSPDLAAEVAQSVFIGLARGAQSLIPRLAPDASLAGWLCRSARKVSLNLRRDESRRHSRERQAMQQLDAISESAPDWEQLRPVLDEAMSELDETDYDALVLRFFKSQDLRSVGLAQGVSDDTAQKRVSRALDKLRDYLSRRGIRTTTTALSVVLTANAVQAAPVGLALSISSAAAIAGTSITTTATASATKVIAMTTLQKTVVTATVAVLAGLGIYEARQASQLREQVQTLQQQQAPLAELNLLLQRERDDASRQLAALREENDSLNQNAAELLRLRGEVGRLRKDSQALAQIKGTHSDEVLNHAGFWLKNLDQIKHYLEQTPNAKIPELQFLHYGEWLDAVKSGLFTTNDFRHAASQLRRQADRVVGGILRNALARYRENNHGQFPTDVSQLKPYFERSKNRVDSDAPITELDAILQRWEIVPATQIRGLVAGGDLVITQKAPVDSVFDSRVVVGHGVLDGSFARTDTMTTLESVRAAYQAAHQGKHARESAELEPYVSTPEQKAALERLMLSEKWWE